MVEAAPTTKITAGRINSLPASNLVPTNFQNFSPLSLLPTKLPAETASSLTDSARMPFPESSSHSGVKYVMILRASTILALLPKTHNRKPQSEIQSLLPTITPFCAPPEQAPIQPYSNAEMEKTRQRVNQWIRTSGRFDAVVDFDKILRNPKNGSMLADEYNTGDYLHPNVAR
ncbi:hypothetical protein EV426DRAFT_716427 [Tirmania nivea]|nr:hypothetical protein EV426DRAFT_716427 [Tirmania nivea]